MNTKKYPGCMFTDKKTFLLPVVTLALYLVSINISLALTIVNTINVNTLSDTVDANPDSVCADTSGECSLRAAIQTANFLGGNNAIMLPAGTITLSLGGADEINSATGDLNVNNGNLSIVGWSVDEPTIIDAVKGWDDRILQLGAGTLSLYYITLRGGNVTGSGGAIKTSVNTSLTMKNCRVSGNYASSNGGGISAAGVDVIIENSRIDGNSSNFNGGGIIATALNTTIRSSTIDGNTAANAGGGVNAGSTSGLVNIVNSTISSNKADSSGGGILAGENVNLYNVTITENIAAYLGLPAYGGGIYMLRPVNIRNSIIAANNASFYIASLVSTPDCYTADTATAYLVSQNYNLIGDMTGCSMSHTDTGEQLGDASNPVDPKLGPLQNNGGATATHALLTGSPAIDAGNPNGCVDETDTEMLTDQRGYERPLDGDSDGALVCDLGSLEFDPSSIATTNAGSGGGGCSLAKNSRFDPVLPGLLLLAFFYIGLQRKNRPARNNQGR